MTESLILVDQHDREIGLGEKLEVHRNALLHRAFSVFIYRQNNDIELLLQQRHPSKYHCGGLWTNTCCSHPRPGELITVAGQRRLQEEMGLNIPLTRVGSFIYKAVFDNGLTEHEYDHVLFGQYENQTITPAPEEVADYQWLTLTALTQDIARHPQRYTPWLKPALDIIIAHGLK